MPRDTWMENTVPSRRSDGGNGEERRTQPPQARIPGHVWVSAVILGVLLFAILSFWGLYLLRGSGGAVAPTPTATIWTATPSPTPGVSPTATMRPPDDGEDQPAPTPIAPSDIEIGGYVEVAGTGVAGLSLREGPGTGYDRMDFGAEGETFVVVEGPQVVAGAPWWRVRDPENQERFWWAIGSYLRPVPGP